MAYQIRASGLEDLQANFEKLGTAALGIASAGLYKGAGIVADTVGSSVKSIATAPFKYAKGGEKRLPSPEEVAMLQGAAYGIAKFRKNGMDVNTRVGFQTSGYAVIPWNHAKTMQRTKYIWSNRKAIQAKKMGYRRKGEASGGASVKPIPVIANAIESGTSFMNKQPFFRKAVNKSRGAAQGAMESTIKTKLESIQLG